jgi:hypothetical protein
VGLSGDHGGGRLFSHAAHAIGRDIGILTLCP